MTQQPQATIRIHVDPTNPGQFFACCGLLELADRLWGIAEGWFDGGKFFLRMPTAGSSHGPTLDLLLDEIGNASLQQVDPADDYSSAVDLPSPFDLRLDWWKDNRAGGNRLKVWAGSMRSVRIARAMQYALKDRALQNETLLNRAMVVYDPIEREKKVEPFYFDARRGAAAQAIDIGFSPDSLQMTTAAYPAVEFLCLVGLQRYRPMPSEKPRVFDYYTWGVPLETRVAPSAVCGQLAHVNGRGFRFENAFRTDQRKHKAFTPATPFSRSET